MRTSLRWTVAGMAVPTVAAGTLLMGPDRLPLGHGLHWTAADRVSEAAVVLGELAVLTLVVLLITHRNHPSTSELVRITGLDRPKARRELVGLAGYLVLVQLIGAGLGLVTGGGPISFHLAGSIHGADHPPSPSEAIGWAAYNAIVYVVVPLWWFGRRHSRARLWLRSKRPGRDLLVVVVVLALETAAQLTIFGAAFLALTSTQMGAGVALSLGLSFLGTVLPTLVVVAALVVPRVLVITGSPVAAVVVGGLTYTTLHLFDGWADFGSVQAATMSVCLLVLQYLAPGMFKAFLTVRTGNAWVHAWAYHAVAPHVWADTPLMVRIFGIR